MSGLEGCRELLRYWIREVLGGTGHRRQLRRRGIDIASVPVSRLGLDPARAHNHANSGGPDLEHVLRELGLGQGDSILDLGCGKGGALLTMAALPFRRIAGLELSRDMLAVARENLSRAGVSHVELMEGDASEFADYDGFTVVYMYNPFPQTVLRRVVEHMEASVARAPRSLTIIYKNPRFHEDLVRNGVFREVRRFDHSGHPFAVYECVQSS